MWKFYDWKMKSNNEEEQPKCFLYPYEKGSYDFTTVSMSIGKCVFSETACRMFLKLLMKLRCLKGKKLMDSDFLEKISFWG